MKKLLQLLFILITGSLSAQTIITDTPTEAICANRKFLVSFKTSGNFNPDNRFRVQLTYSYSNPNSTKVNNVTINVSEESNKSPIEVIIPDTVSAYQAQLRVISSSPAIQGFPSNNIYPRFPVIASISGEYFKNIDDQNTIYLNNFKGQTPFEITFDDSTKVKTNGSQFYFSPQKTGIYKVAKVTNECGEGRIKGSLNFYINPISFKIITSQNSNASEVCPSTKTFITYASEKAFDANNIFKLVFYQKNNLNVVDKTFELPVITENNNTVSFIIPESFEKNNLEYNLVSTSPVSYSQKIGIYVSSIPKYKIITENLDVALGEKARIRFSQIDPTGYGISWTDGKNILQGLYTYSTNVKDEYEIEIEPTFSTTYKIANIPGTCASLAKIEGKTNINVTTGFVITSSPKMICDNGVLEVKIKKLGVFPANNKFTFEISNPYNSPNLINIPAELVNDTTLRAVNVGNLTSNYESYVYSNQLLNVVSSNPSIRSASKEINLNRVPNISVQNYYNLEIETGKGVFLPLSLTAGRNDSNYQLLINDGEKDFTASIYTRNVYPIKTTTYTIKSITGDCGTQQLSNQTLNVKVTSGTATQSIVSRIPKNTSVCAGESIKIPFFVNGNKDTSDVYTAQIRKDVSGQIQWFDIGSSKTSPIAATIPADSKTTSYGEIRINNKKRSAVSVFETDQYITIKNPPTGFVYTNKIEAISNEDFSLRVVVQGSGICNYTLSNGMKGVSDNTNNFETSKDLKLNFNQSQFFSITSISNECGVGTVKGSQEVVVKPFRILTHIKTQFVCEGNILVVPYQIEGKLPENAELIAQISGENGNFGDIPTRKEKEGVLIATIPEGLYNPYTYNRSVRIVAKNLDGFYPYTLTANLGTLPKATLTAEDGTDKALISNYTNGVKLVVNTHNKMSGSWQLNPSENVTYDYNNYAIVKPLTKTTYSLKSLNNQCGYGVFDGKVTVSVAPNITATTTNTASSLCGNDKYTFNINVAGDFEDDNLFKIELVSLTNGNAYKITETKSFSSPYSFVIPNTLTNDYYGVRISSSNPKYIYPTQNTINGLSNFYMNSLPNATIYGNTVVNAGEGTNIFLKISSGQLPISYTLSDGTKGTFSSPNYSNELFLINILPKQTTQYTLTSISNNCGVGKSNGSVNIEVNPVTALSLQTTNIKANTGLICAGKTITVDFTQKGAFTGNEKFSIQMSDNEGKNFKNIVSRGTKSPLQADIPATTPIGDAYRFRVVADNNAVSSSANNIPVSIRIAATARLLTNSVVIEPNQLTSAKFSFTGTKPYSFQFGTDSLTAGNYYAPDSSITIPLQIKTSNQNYKLYSVYNNECGLGVILGNNVLKVELITATSESLNEIIQVYPNPTSNRIFINSQIPIEKLQLIDINGKIIKLNEELNRKELDLQPLPSGIYLLKIQLNNHTATYKIIKD